MVNEESHASSKDYDYNHIYAKSENFEPLIYPLINIPLIYCGFSVNVNDEGY